MLRILDKTPSMEKSVELLEFVKDSMRRDGVEERAVVYFENHSLNVSKAAVIIGVRLLKVEGSVERLDLEKLKILGMLHDVGRYIYERKSKRNHSIVGYELMMEQGFDDVARVSITHGFMGKKFTNTHKRMYCYNQNDIDFVQKYLDGIKYDWYDKIICFCDFLAMGDGFCSIERIFADLRRRYLEFPIEEMDMAEARVFICKKEFDKVLGVDVYDLLGIEI